MLFNSYIFIFAFLPVTLFGFHWLGSRGYRTTSITWLVVCSLFFYSWWNPNYLWIILVSIFFNYKIGIYLSSSLEYSRKKLILILGIVVNLTLLGYYKYVNFFLDNLNAITGSEFILGKVVLPLAISFFTFQQIAYLVDVWRGYIQKYNFLHYCLFVTFFPQLIAGPIVHHKEMLPQFLIDTVYRVRSKNIAIGLSIFAIGLFKKVILADGASVYAIPIFNAAEAGINLTFFEAWMGALAYTFQLYFDFSGYSDMAIGLARMFGIRLPLNFNSPYKATSIIDFWKRWHITLSRFLRDYLYIPLGGSRKGEYSRFYNILITMVIGGLWHGAGWTFVFWGLMHGIYIIINHVWRRMTEGSRVSIKNNGLAAVNWIITMVAIVIAWVPFRAESFDGALSILTSMVGMHGLSVSSSLIGNFGITEEWLLNHGLIFNGFFYNGLVSNPYFGIVWIVFLFIISIALPNTQQIMSNYHPTFEIYKCEISKVRFSFLEWSPTTPWVLFISMIFSVSVLGLNKVSEFLYFQF